MNPQNLNFGLRLLVLATLVGTLWLLPLQGLAAEGTWEQLPPREQRVLKPYARQWPELSAEKQKKLRRGARLWSRMNERDRDRARERFRSWQQLPPEEQRDIRSRFDEFQRLPKSQRLRLLAARRWYLGLSSERRDQFRKEWDGAAPNPSD